MIRQIFIAAATLALISCGEGESFVKDEQAQKAATVANSIRFSENAEIDNIKKRLEQNSDPGAVGFILLLNEMGQPIMYTGVIGKITSSGKRLTKPFKEVCCDGAYHPSPSDEGTWGSSDQYIFFWTTDGQYIQWNGKYLYSDKPFRTSERPLIISTGS